MPKVDPNLMPKALRGKSFEQLAAMQAQAKKAPPAPTSPVSSSGGRPASSSINRATSSSPESPQQEQTVPLQTVPFQTVPLQTSSLTDLPGGASAAALTAAAQPAKSVRAKLFKSEQSSPDHPHAPTSAAATFDGPTPVLPQSNGHHEQVTQEVSQHLQAEQQLFDSQQQQQHLQVESQFPEPHQQPQQQAQPKQQQQQQQQQSGMQQIVKPHGPATLRDTIKLQLLQDAPSGKGLPENVRQYFMKLVSSTLDLSVEKDALRQSIQQRDAEAEAAKEQLEEIQGQLEYQAEQMMDLQNQVSLAQFWLLSVELPI